ncbi:MAG: hypothetical protein MUF15_01235, partial [Acidobacteria bacterium]|nr:hypothetical protein [Acidobacteriota bacterium]
MKIFIITMEDPVYTVPFIREIIEKRQKDIIGLAISKGNRFTLPKKRSKMMYMFSLLLIMGITYFIKYAFITIRFKLKKKLAKTLRFIHDPSLVHWARQKGIKTFIIDDPNSSVFVR